MRSRLEGVSYAPRLPFVGSLIHLQTARKDLLLDAADALGDTFGLDLGPEQVLVVGHPADAARVLEERPDAYPDKGDATGFRRSRSLFLAAGCQRGTRWTTNGVGVALGWRGCSVRALPYPTRR